MKYNVSVESNLMTNQKLPAITILILCFLLGTFGLTFASEAVWGDFTNSLKPPPGINPDVIESTSAVFFGGHVKVSPDENDVMVEPTDGTHTLALSSFGQMVSHKGSTINNFTFLLVKSCNSN
jgi:hypothetical protein